MSAEVKVSVPEAVDIIKNGGTIILTDDEGRENEGDLVTAAEFVTPESINFMAAYGRGLICLSLAAEICDRLALPQMVRDNDCKFGTAFTVSIEAKKGVTTGISAFDRAKTILTAIDPASKPGDLARPGHVFPLRARDGGVLVRAGQTEGSVDLARMAGLTPAGVICEIMDDDGRMARMPSLEKFAAKHGLKIVTVADIIQYRLANEEIVETVASAKMPTSYGEFVITGFMNKADGREAVALIKGDLTGDEPVPVRVHSQCFTGDVFSSRLCGCGDKLRDSLKTISEEGRGVLLYLYKDTGKAGFLSTEEGCISPHEHKDTELRDYGFGATILRKLGLKKIRLLTDAPKPVKCLSAFGLELS